MPKILPGDENTLLHTHPHNPNRPLEKTDLGIENPEPHSFRNDLRNGALYGSWTRNLPKNETAWRNHTSGDKRTWALCRNNKKWERMDITQRRHNNSDNTNTPTPITGIRIDVQKNGTECRDGEGST